jgi:hypothetical protein
MNLICGGDFSTVHQQGAQPSTVSVVLTPGPDDGIDNSSPINEIDIPANQVSTSGGVFSLGNKLYFSTARVIGSPTGGWNYTPNPSTVTLGNKLATALATAFYGWQTCAFDLCYAGVAPWHPTAFDDAVEWRLDYDRDLVVPGEIKRGGYVFHTRVQSLPPNCGFSDVPQVIDFEPMREVVVQLKTVLNPGSRCQAAIISSFGSIPYPGSASQPSPPQLISVGDGIGLCEAIQPGPNVIGSAREVPGIGYLLVALHCKCSSS